MTEQLPQPFDAALPRFPGLLDHGIVEPNRRLIPVGASDEESIEEYMNPITKERLIALTEGSETVELHRGLARAALQVFPVVRSEGGKVLLDVPADARTVQGSLRFIARDIVNYAPTFLQIGDLMARLQISGFGLPQAKASRAILAGLAVASVDNSRYGSGLTLIPPYTLDTAGTKLNLVETLRQEVVDSGYFTPAKADFLMRQVDEGWNEFRY